MININNRADEVIAILDYDESLLSHFDKSGVSISSTFNNSTGIWALCNGIAKVGNSTAVKITSKTTPSGTIHWITKLK